MKLLLLVGLAVIGWRMLFGSWPWETLRTRPRAADDRARARALLGLGGDADRAAILAAHRRLLARIHPDRGGSSEAVHAADGARDVLLAALDARETGRR